MIIIGFVPDRSVRTNAASHLRRGFILNIDGEFAYEVSMPAKSGVGGGILGVAPGRASIAVSSPGLNAKGNSAVGTLAMASLGWRTQWSVFGPAEA